MKVVWMAMIWSVILPLAAQETAGLEVPDRPAGRLLDQAGLFSSTPERAEELSRSLEAFVEETGYSVYVAFFGTLIGWDLSELTRRLERDWVDEGPGLVFVVESDAGRWQLGWVDGPELYDEDGRRMEVRSRLDVVDLEKLAVRNRLNEAGEMRVASADDGFERVEILLAGLREALEPGDPAAGKRDRRRFWVLVTGLVAGALLVGMLGSAGIRWGERRRRERFVFPEVEVGSRLGAPRGGGKIRTRSFR